ncbi:hypothetical protein B0T10DRAFT_484895 [Thelonectria olida]|uniref:C2H2-type domain-containing protein n=1 Tax=Thelonectria olida TaxID=1576542 RepID=A0A9P8W8W3_9HYPO|nr:hypothetical protein B0T10DRAFT_484895 [Thelonectria olida]
MLSIQGLLSSPDDEPRTNPTTTATQHVTGTLGYSPSSQPVQHDEAALATGGRHRPQPSGSSSGSSSSQPPPRSESDIGVYIDELLKRLDSRGKGMYTCPYEHACQYGGVDRNGTLAIFERNSAFKLHLRKHERPFKCDLPGCTNTRGFARCDQLRRHQDQVRHG